MAWESREDTRPGLLPPWSCSCLKLPGNSQDALSRGVQAGQIGAAENLTFPAQTQPQETVFLMFVSLITSELGGLDCFFPSVVAAGSRTGDADLPRAYDSCQNPVTPSRRLIWPPVFRHRR